MSTQSLKAALNGRVRNDQALRLGSARQNLGEGLMCPASAGFLQHDVYGRPVNQNQLLINDASCSHYTIANAKRRIGIENNERPYLPTAAAGYRYPGDLMGVGRDIIPEGIYPGELRGDFKRTYLTPNDAPPEYLYSDTSYEPEKFYAPFDFSHDATSFLYRG